MSSRVDTPNDGSPFDEDGEGGGGRGPGGARFDRMLDIVSGGSRLRVDILIRRSGMRKTSRRMFFFLLWPMSSVLGPTTTTTTTEIEKKTAKHDRVCALGTAEDRSLDDESSQGQRGWRPARHR